MADEQHGRAQSIPNRQRSNIARTALGVLQRTEASLSPWVRNWWQRGGNGHSQTGEGAALGGVRSPLVLRVSARAEQAGAGSGASARSAGHAGSGMPFVQRFAQMITQRHARMNQVSRRYESQERRALAPAASELPLPGVGEGSVRRAPSGEMSLEELAEVYQVQQRMGGDPGPDVQRDLDPSRGAESAPTNIAHLQDAVRRAAQMRAARSETPSEASPVQRTSAGEEPAAAPPAPAPDRPPSASSESAGRRGSIAAEIEQRIRQARVQREADAREKAGPPPEAPAQTGADESDAQRAPGQEEASSVQRQPAAQEDAFDSWSSDARPELSEQSSDDPDAPGFSVAEALQARIQRAREERSAPSRDETSSADSSPSTDPDSPRYSKVAALEERIRRAQVQRSGEQRDSAASTSTESASSTSSSTSSTSSPASSTSATVSPASNEPSVSTDPNDPNYSRAAAIRERLEAAKRGQVQRRAGTEDAGGEAPTTGGDDGESDDGPRAASGGEAPGGRMPDGPTGQTAGETVQRTPEPRAGATETPAQETGDGESAQESPSLVDEIEARIEAAQRRMADRQTGPVEGGASPASAETDASGGEAGTSRETAQWSPDPGDETIGPAADRSGGGDAPQQKPSLAEQIEARIQAARARQAQRASEEGNEDPDTAAQGRMQSFSAQDDSVQRSPELTSSEQSHAEALRARVEEARARLRGDSGDQESSGAGGAESQRRQAVQRTPEERPAISRDMKTRPDAPQGEQGDLPRRRAFSRSQVLTPERRTGDFSAGESSQQGAGQSAVQRTPQEPADQEPSEQAGVQEETPSTVQRATVQWATDASQEESSSVDTAQTAASADDAAASGPSSTAAAPEEIAGDPAAKPSVQRQRDDEAASSADTSPAPPDPSSAPHDGGAIHEGGEATGQAGLQREIDDSAAASAEVQESQEASTNAIQRSRAPSRPADEPDVPGDIAGDETGTPTARAEGVQRHSETASATPEQDEDDSSGVVQRSPAEKREPAAHEAAATDERREERSEGRAEGSEQEPGGAWSPEPRTDAPEINRAVDPAFVESEASPHPVDAPGPVADETSQTSDMDVQRAAEDTEDTREASSHEPSAPTPAAPEGRAKDERETVRRRPEIGPAPSEETPSAQAREASAASQEAEDTEQVDDSQTGAPEPASLQRQPDHRYQDTAQNSAPQAGEDGGTVDAAAAGDPPPAGDPPSSPAGQAAPDSSSVQRTASAQRTAAPSAAEEEPAAASSTASTAPPSVERRPGRPVTGDDAPSEDTPSEDGPAAGASSVQRSPDAPAYEPPATDTPSAGATTPDLDAADTSPSVQRSPDAPAEEPGEFTPPRAFGETDGGEASVPRRPEASGHDAPFTERSETSAAGRKVGREPAAPAPPAPSAAEPGTVQRRTDERQAGERSPRPRTAPRAVVQYPPGFEGPGQSPSGARVVPATTTPRAGSPLQRRRDPRLMAQHTAKSPPLGSKSPALLPQAQKPATGSSPAAAAVIQRSPYSASRPQTDGDASGLEERVFRAEEDSPAERERSASSLPLADSRRRRAGAADATASTGSATRSAESSSAAEPVEADESGAERSRWKAAWPSARERAATQPSAAGPDMQSDSDRAGSAHRDRETFLGASSADAETHWGVKEDEGRRNSRARQEGERTDEESGRSSGASPGRSAGEESSAGSRDGPEPNLDELARAILPVIKRMLMVERERHILR